MKKFHELTPAQQTKAKEHAKEILIDRMLDGTIVIDTWPNLAAAKVWAGALLMKQKNMIPAAKAYLLQSQMFMRAMGKIIEAAAEAAMYPEETDYLISGVV